MRSITNNRKSKPIFAFILILCLILSYSIGFAEEMKIKDLDLSSDYARLYILDLVSRGIIEGDENGYFHPIKPISRIEMLTLVVRMLELDITNPPTKATFSDVPKSHWAFPYIEAAYKKGIVKGVNENYFVPDNTCTREEMTTMFVRSLGFEDVEIVNSNDPNSIYKLTDKEMISDWAEKYIAFAMTTGLVNGTSDTTFSPKGNATREQAAVLTFRFIEEKYNIANFVYGGGTKSPSVDTIKLAESIILIETYDKNKELMAQGSGFSIGNGLFLTNYHVLQGSDNYKIVTIDGKEYEVEGIVKYSEDVDLAIIKTNELINVKPLNVEPIKTSQLKQDVVAIGNPNGQQGVVSTGIVNELRQIEYRENGVLDIIESTAPLSPGSSGGALFDLKGNVIGVTSATSNDGSLSYAVSIVHALEWIDELKKIDFDKIPVLDITDEVKKYLDISDQGIKDTIIRAITSLENEDIETYMSTVHSFNPSYKEIRPMHEELFQMYDLDYNIKEINIIEKSYDEANVEIVYTIEKVSGPAFENTVILGQYFLVKEYGEWRVLFAQETSIEDPDNNLGQFDTESISELPKNLSISDSIIHPTKPIVYISDATNNKLYAYNYETMDIKESSFNLSPESLYFTNNELYVSMLTGEHSSYWKNGEQTGVIAILNGDTLQINEQFNIDIDPYDIVVDREGYIFVTSGSGQHTFIKGYSRQTKDEVTIGTIRQKSVIKLHPTMNKIYALNTDVSPRDMSVYNITQGKFPIYLNSYYRGIDSPYHGDYKMDTDFKISPDGNYVFNYAGTVFYCPTDKLSTITYHDTLDQHFTDITFDLDNNRFFTAIKEVYICEYDYSKLERIKTYRTQGEIAYLFNRDNNIIAITTTRNGHLVEKIKLPQ